MILLKRDSGTRVVQNILNPCDKDTIDPKLGSEGAREPPRRSTFLQYTTDTDPWIVDEENQTSQSDIEYRPKGNERDTREKGALLRSDTRDATRRVNSHIFLGKATRCLSVVHLHL